MHRAGLAEVNRYGADVGVGGGGGRLCRSSGLQTLEWVWQLNLNCMLLYLLEERLLPWSQPSALVSAERLKTGPNCNSVSSS